MAKRGQRGPGTVLPPTEKLLVVGADRHCLVMMLDEPCLGPVPRLTRPPPSVCSHPAPGSPEQDVTESPEPPCCTKDTA